MRRSPLVVAVLVHALAWPAGPVVATGPQDAPAVPPRLEQVPTFGVGTAAVTLDVVVRDKKGRAVRDLKTSDFEVFEDGVKQTIDSFRVFGRPLDETAPVAPRPAAAPAPGPAPAPAPAPLPAIEPEDRPQIIAFVFDRLTATARTMAQKAALTYLEKGHVEGDLVGVFSIDLALRTLQPFTRETGLIRAGLERAASQANTDFASNRQQTRGLVDAISTAEQTTDAISNTSFSGPTTASSSSLGAVAGAADVMLFPDLLSANLTVKAIMYTADCAFGGVLCGAACPVVFMSRADTAATRLNSLALAVRLASGMA